MVYLADVPMCVGGSRQGHRGVNKYTDKQQGVPYHVRHMALGLVHVSSV